VFVLGKLFNPNLMFLSKAGAYLSEAPSGAILGWASCLAYKH